jgi:hypothetical protein
MQQSDFSGECEKSFKISSFNSGKPGEKTHILLYTHPGIKGGRKSRKCEIKSTLQPKNVNDKNVSYSYLVVYCDLLPWTLKKSALLHLFLYTGAVESSLGQQHNLNTNLAIYFVEYS